MLNLLAKHCCQVQSQARYFFLVSGIGTLLCQLSWYRYRYVTLSSENSWYKYWYRYNTTAVTLNTGGKSTSGQQIIIFSLYFYSQKSIDNARLKKLQLYSFIQTVSASWQQCLRFLSTSISHPLRERFQCYQLADFSFLFTFKNAKNTFLILVCLSLSTFLQNSLCNCIFNQVLKQMAIP